MKRNDDDDDDDDREDDTQPIPATEHAQCPLCGGQGLAMGMLGATQWFRCRHCAAVFNEDGERES